MNEHMTLLQHPKDQGYPAEYLLARIRGRRSRLVRDWKAPLFSAGPFDLFPVRGAGSALQGASADIVWENLVREYAWAYGQMQLGLREVFAPYFLYTEIRTLVVCFRRLKNEMEHDMNELLSVSLLSNEVKEAITDSPDLASAVSGIERLFSTLSDRFQGLRTLLDAEGLRSVEQRLTETYLAITAGSGLHPLMKQFFGLLIDSRNILSLYKSLCYESASGPLFIAGGFLSEFRMRQAVRNEGRQGIGSLIREGLGMSVPSLDATRVEQALYRALTRWSRRIGRLDASGIGTILDYLWQCSIEAMNWSVLYFGKDLEREIVAAELVQ